MSKESLIEYAKVKVIEINENDSFNDIFKQVTGKSYESYLKKLTKRKEKEERAEYENIPQRKQTLKKNNIEIVAGLFQGEEKIQTILKPKEGKRIIVLNLYIRETLQSDLKNANNLITGNYDGDILVKFKLPCGYEIEYINIDKYKTRIQE